MLRLASFDVVFQEIPGEVTLALNLSGCPNRCAGCHSPHLWEEVGEPLDDNLLNSLLSGPYVAHLGGLDSASTNQRLYRVTDGEMKDITAELRNRDRMLLG